jgi:hypothetical protein
MFAGSVGPPVASVAAGIGAFVIIGTSAASVVTAVTGGIDAKSVGVAATTVGDVVGEADATAVLGDALDVSAAPARGCTTLRTGAALCVVGVAEAVGVVAAGAGAWSDVARMPLAAVATPPPRTTAVPAVAMVIPIRRVNAMSPTVHHTQQKIKPEFHRLVVARLCATGAGWQKRWQQPARGAIRCYWRRCSQARKHGDCAEAVVRGTRPNQAGIGFTRQGSLVRSQYRPPRLRGR